MTVIWGRDARDDGPLAGPRSADIPTATDGRRAAGVFGRAIAPDAPLPGYVYIHRVSRTNRRTTAAANNINGLHHNRQDRRRTAANRRSSDVARVLGDFLVEAGPNNPN